MKKSDLPLRRPDDDLTYRDYKSWPAEEHWELIHGVTYSMSAASDPNHRKLTEALLTELQNFLEGKGCRVRAASLDVLLPDELGQDVDEFSTVVQPDIAVICDKKKFTKQGCIGPPDLIIEILSPSISPEDMEVKNRLYEEYGVREFWILDPGNRNVQVYLLDGREKYPADPAVYTEDGTVSCAVLPGLLINLGEIFRKLD
ncbi:MAG: Uma2 family endonuclease [Spirochaetales bacterium]|nr:MAG: Uma2 family endonuclease [Spirochaetales bacterium]